MSCSAYFFLCHVRAYFLYSHPRACFFMSCSGLTRTSLSWIPGTRCACPRMTEEKIIPSFLYFYSFLSFPYLLSLSSFPGLTGESVKDILGSSPRMTRKKNALSFERAGSNYSLVIWDIFSLTTAGVYFSTLLSTLREASFSLTLLLSSSPESSSRIRA